ncbi:hypothetical protein L9F63_026256, partial [Diploptera punctata]
VSKFHFAFPPHYVLFPLIHYERGVYVSEQYIESTDIYLLDDPLSAVDTHVGKHLFDDFTHSDASTFVMPITLSFLIRDCVRHPQGASNENFFQKILHHYSGGGEEDNENEESKKRLSNQLSPQPKRTLTGIIYPHLCGSCMTTPCHVCHEHLVEIGYKILSNVSELISIVSNLCPCVFVAVKRQRPLGPPEGTAPQSRCLILVHSRHSSYTYRQIRYSNHTSASYHDVIFTGAAMYRVL